jgi:hypothetical protein
MLLITLLLGAGAAVLRGFQLSRSFNANALIEPGDPVTVLLIIVSVVFAVIAFVFVRQRIAKADAPTESRSLGIAWFLVQFAALSFLFSSSVIELINGFSTDFSIRWSAVCLGVLGVLSTVSLFMIALNINRHPSGSAAGFWATLPVFWSCLMLVTDFWGQAGVPVRSAYVYGMFGAVFCTVALYSIAGFFFGRGRPAGTLFYAFSSVFFSVLTLGGYLLATQLGEPIYSLSLTSMLRYGFIILHLTAAAWAVLTRRFEPAPAEEESEEEGGNQEG